MRAYWEGTVRSYETDENGKVKKVSKTYLVDAVNHTEVEAILTKKMAEIVKGKFEIKPIRQSDVTAVISDNFCGKYWKLKFEYELDKKITEVRLVEAESINEAVQSFVNAEGDFMHEYEVISVTRSKVLDVYEYVSPGQVTIEGEIDFRVDLSDAPTQRVFEPISFAESDPIEDIVGSISSVKHHFPQLEERIPGDPDLLTKQREMDSFNETYSATNTDEAPRPN